MVKKENIWKFNDDDWKVHIADDEIRQKLADNFGLDRSTIYYESGKFDEETSWDIIVPDKLIKKVKKFLKDNT
tara:strand:- start:287 stop:505 length:219 start_codon:yes stop_codon:yes gene_type:complete